MQAADKNLTTLVRLILPLVAVVVFATTWAFIGLESPWTARAYAELRNNSPIYFWAMYLIMLGGVAINYPIVKATKHAGAMSTRYWIFFGFMVVLLTFPIIDHNPPTHRPLRLVSGLLHVVLGCLGYVVLLNFVQRLSHRLR